MQYRKRIQNALQMKNPDEEMFVVLVLITFYGYIC